MAGMAPLRRDAGHTGWPMATLHLGSALLRPDQGRRTESARLKPSGSSAAARVPDQAALCAGAMHARVVRACDPHARVACVCCVCPCCACPRSPCVCLLRVPLLCVPGAVRALAVRSRAARLRARRVVCLCSVRPDRAHFARQSRRHRGGAPARALCWHCTCLRCARLRFPCSRFFHLLCVTLLCVPALCAFVRRVVCLCSARLHRTALVDVADTSPLVDSGDLTCPSGDRTHALTHSQSQCIALACPHAACYCTCLSYRHVVCLCNVLLYLLVLSCTRMPLLISDIPFKLIRLFYHLFCF